MSSVEDVLGHREYWIDKAKSQFDELMMLSLDGDEEKHTELQDDLITSLTILWRFDRKLEDAKLST